MNKFLTIIIVFLISTITFSQTPEKMSYQAVLRDANNVLLVNQQVGMQISILQGETAVYVETQTPTTNSNGLVSLEIGNGSIVTGNFSDIDWSVGTYFIKTETDLTGGATYTITGKSQILSVPYAIHAKTAEMANNGLPAEGEVGEVLKINDNGVPFWSADDFIKLNDLPSNIMRDNIEVYLPPYIYVGLGRIIEIYNNQVGYMGNDSNFIFQWSATNGSVKIGKSYRDKFRIDASSGDTQLVGDYDLSLKVFDSNGSLVAEAFSIIKISGIGDDITDPIEIIGIGDSLLNKELLPECRNLINDLFGKDVLHFTGTVPYKNQSEQGAEYLSNEGRSGYRQDQYLSAGWGGNIKIKIDTVNNPIVEIPALKKVYTFSTNRGERIYEVEELLNENNEIYPENGGTLTYITFNILESGHLVTVNGSVSGDKAIETDISVNGDSTIFYKSYEAIGGNPFWNPYTEKVDFNYYFEKNGISEPDAFLTMLGTNSIRNIDGLITLIGLIQNQMPNKSVYVMLPQYSGDYLINPSKRKTFFDFSKGVTESLKNIPNIYLVPNIYCHDSEHNFGWVEEDINPRNPNFKSYLTSDNVHPQKVGYLQIADILMSSILANY